MSNLEAGGGSSPEAPEAGQQGTSPNAPSTSSEQTALQRKALKRDRVALACQRCKTRKQKCDGQRPACASCARLSLKCVYIVPLIPAAGEKKAYIKLLEQRVAELESFLTSLGQPGVGTDHLRRLAATGQTASPPNAASGAQQDVAEDPNDLFLAAVRDLSLSASGHYVGASSNITIGRVLSSVVSSSKASMSGASEEHVGQGEDDPAPKSVYSNKLHDIFSNPILTPQVAHRLVEGWFRHIATRYPTMHSSRVMALHNNRENITDQYDQIILHLIYAVSGRWLESAGEMGHFYSDLFYDYAFENMDSILVLRDSRTIDYLLLMALYCTRAPRDPGAWTYVGAAMRLCIELGLHRRPPRPLLTVEGEMKKRRFWTTYFMDRDISIAIGRPPSISDHDIDAELPFDIDEGVLDDDEIVRASMRVSNIPVNPPLTLTSFIHRTRLKKIESEIQHIVYRVDKPTKVPDTIINGFLEQLNAWKEAVPYDARNYVQQQNSAYEGLEFYTIHYHRCVRFLLYPQLSNHSLNLQYVQVCAEACASIIGDYRRLHHVFPVGFSALSIQSVFLAGLTLIYCAWLAPVGLISIDGPLTDCQLLLYIVTERYPSARKYRDLFERLKSTILPIIAQGKHEPRAPLALDASVQESFSSIPWGQAMGTDFSYMLNEMTGNAVSPDFDVGLDSSMVGTQHTQPQQSPDVNTFGVWPTIGDIHRGIYQ